MTLHVAMVVFRYSILVLDKDTFGYFLLLKEIDPHLCVNIDIIVDLILNELHGRSILVNPSSQSSILWL